MDSVMLALFVAGLVLLIIGAELLVRGASRLAAALGISPLVIGLTVVGYGTSSPELAVTVQASLLGQSDITLGNVVGSNILNVLLILGISAMVTPLVVSRQLVRWDVPLMIGVSFLLLLLALDGKVGRLDGLLLFTGNVAYVVWAIRQSRKESARVRAEYAKKFGDGQTQSGERWLIQIALIIGGLILLVLGSRWLVNGAVAIAQVLGLSELIIGLTIVAVGTSLPEVATSIVAGIRGERDIAVGNVVGSNLFNILAVLGLASAVATNGVSVSTAALRFDIPVMIAVAVACLPIFFTGHVIARWEGALFLSYYVAYLLYLVLGAAQHDALPMFSKIMMAFIIPLTAATLLVLVVRAAHASFKATRQAASKNREIPRDA
jgi:cation:H+ antiporter